ncbi:MAG: GerMN domain-containing protein [Firmicutes bacterium]|nr:GerMN domain-containing protein [Bacillota bacterium]
MDTMRKRYTGLFLTLILILGTLAGCGSDPVDTEGDKQLEHPAKLYFVSSEYLETGDETIEPMVIVETTVTTPVEEADDIYETTLDLLVQVPEEGTDTMLREAMVEDVTVTDSIAVVDFNGELMHGGSMEEVYLIEQVVRTLVKSFDDISAVKFTVDGMGVDSLMGHLEANCTYGLITVEEDGNDVELVTIMEE